MKIKYKFGEYDVNYKDWKEGDKVQVLAPYDKFDEAAFEREELFGGSFTFIGRNGVPYELQVKDEKQLCTHIKSGRKVNDDFIVCVKSLRRVK